MTAKDKTLKKYVQKIELTFPKSDAIVSDVKLIEPSGDYTLITFTNRKLNVPIDKKEFEH
jgi:outer membrane lipoprotein carrier protein